MNYISTRNCIKASAAEAVAAGLAPDGGLFLPASFPAFTGEDLRRMEEMDYAGRAVEVLSRFLDGFSREEIGGYVRAAYAAPKFPAHPAPVVSAGAGEAYILELFRGPTCAFKDFALQLLPHLLTASLQKTGTRETAVILVATSGDTGKAALEGFADVEGAKICVFYPEGGTSEIQRLQMVTQPGENVMVFAAAGNFDDAQSGVKAIFSDRGFARTLREKGYVLSSANSINWGRLAPQVVYYFSAYCDLRKRGALAEGQHMNVAVPTGNFGNILAAYLAKKCGLPVGKLICASNRNDVLTEFLSTGVYNKNRAFYITASPSMDILISSNLERLLYLLCGGEQVKEYMAALTEKGGYRVDGVTLEKLQEEFACGSADDAQTAAEIKAVYDRTGYLCDPHTAVAYRVWESYKESTGDGAPTVVASTASPFKFADSVLSALGETPEGDQFTRLERLSRITGQEAPGPLASLANKPARFSRVVVPGDMKNAVAAWLAE